MEKKNTEISARIAEIIERVGDTPNSFAKKLGYARAQTVYDILNGKSAPSYDFFNRLANSEYSVTTDLRWLLTGNPSKGENPPISSQTTTPIESSNTNAFIMMIREKDETIKEQAEEIGRLKEQIRQMQHRLEKYASDALTSGTANVG